MTIDGYCRRTRREGGREKGERKAYNTWGCLGCSALNGGSYEGNGGRGKPTVLLVKIFIIICTNTEYSKNAEKSNKSVRNFGRKQKPNFNN